MVLQDLLDGLAYGEFSNLAIVSPTTGTIKDSAYPKVIAQVNRALRELYKRFMLKKKDCMVQQQEGFTTYYLRTDSIDTDITTEDDLGDPFADDVIRILSAIDMITGLELPLNDPKHPDTGVFTKAHDTIHMIPSNPLKTIKITYQASYPKIVITEDFKPDKYTLYFPSFIEEALTAYVASLLVQGKVTRASEGESYASNTYDYKYEAACQKIINLGLAEEANTLFTGFESRGWV
jgi:hypothetical protein